MNLPRIGIVIGIRRRTRQGGFTLVELTAVIAVLGVLAATAMPRMTALAGEARHVSLHGARASLATVATLAHAKHLINRQATQTFEDSTVTLVHGYPAATQDTADAAGLAVDYVVRIDAPGAMSLVPRDLAGTARAADCFLVYEQASAANPVPRIATGGNTTPSTCN
jgi:MSHA pilin protein MshA